MSVLNGNGLYTNYKKWIGEMEEMRHKEADNNCVEGKQRNGIGKPVTQVISLSDTGVDGI